jgi:hypothetical protein
MSSSGTHLHRIIAHTLLSCLVWLKRLTCAQPRDPIIEASTLADSVHMVFNVYGPRPCLGVRRRQPVSEDSATAR